MRKFFSIVKWLAVLTAGIIVSTIVCWLLIPDEPLDQGVVDLMASVELPADEDNMYFMLWGLRAAPSMTSHTAGRRLVAQHEAQLDAHGELKDFRPEDFLGAEPFVIKPATGNCDEKIPDCLRHYQALQPQLEEDLEKYYLPLLRYRGLREYPHFSERVYSYTITSPFPEYQTVAAMGNLVDAQIAVLVASPATRAVALEELAQEVIVWRRVFMQNDMLVTHMIANAMLHRKYRLASEIMRDYPDIARAYPQHMAEITAPLAPDGSLKRALETEFRMGFHLYRDIDRDFRKGNDNNKAGDFLSRVLVAGGAYKANATINLQYARHRDTVTLLEKHPRDILATVAANEEQEEDDGFNPWSPRVLFYNPVGKVLHSIGSPDMSHYQFRVYDLVAYSRLLELQRRIRYEGIETERMPQYLAQAAPGLRNPYTDAAFDWDATARTLSFAGHGKRFLTEGRMQIALAPSAR